MATKPSATPGKSSSGRPRGSMAYVRSVPRTSAVPMPTGNATARPATCAGARGAWWDGTRGVGRVGERADLIQCPACTPVTSRTLATLKSEPAPMAAATWIVPAG
eukprot:4319569-Prymnesium_polylepis.1